MLFWADTSYHRYSISLPIVTFYYLGPIHEAPLLNLANGNPV